MDSIHSSSSSANGRPIQDEFALGLHGVVPERATVDLALEQADEMMRAPVVDTRVRARRLIRALTDLAHANKLRGFSTAYYAGSEKLEQEYGDDLEFVAERVGFNLGTRLRRAKESFKDVYEMGGEPVDDEDPSFKRAYRGFLDSFYGTDNRKARDTYRDRLKKIAAIEGSPIAGDHYFASEAEEIEQSVSEISPADAELLRGRAANAYKLRRLHENERILGMVPGTHREKNDAFKLLEEGFVASGPHKLLTRIHDRQLALGVSLKRPYAERIKMADDAVRSKLHEWGDYLRDANLQGNALADLEKILSSIDESRNLTTVVSKNNPALNALVRHIDVSAVMGGKDRIDFDPLRTKEDRSKQQTEGKNKRVYDVYCGGELDEKLAGHIQEVVASLSVGEAKIYVSEALVSHRVRFRMWTWALRSMRGKYKNTADTIVNDATNVSGEVK